MTRDNITASLYGSAFIGNNVLRVMADAKSGLAHHVLRYIDWLARQLMPDLAETEWLDRHGDIWLVNEGGTVGRKMATYAIGSVTVTAVRGGIVIPVGTRFVNRAEVFYETTALAFTAAADAPAPVEIRALDAGIAGNMDPDETLGMITSIDGVDSTGTVVQLVGGTENENDDDLRMRVLQRIRQPPQGGAAHDYVRWALAVPGVTRAWVAPLEMGMGTITVRVLFDDLRADDDGWPQGIDLERVTAYIDTVRPVAVKDFWVLAPIKQTIDVKISNLKPDNNEVRAAVEASLNEMLYTNAAPGQTIFATWKAQAVMNTADVISFDLGGWDDDVMESPGHMAVLGDVVYG